MSSARPRPPTQGAAGGALCIRGVLSPRPCARPRLGQPLPVFGQVLRGVPACVRAFRTSHCPLDPASGPCPLLHREVRADESSQMRAVMSQTLGRINPCTHRRLHRAQRKGPLCPGSAPGGTQALGGVCEEEAWPPVGGQ